MNLYDEAEKYYHEEKYNEAIKLYEQLENENHAKAIYSLGWCYEHGEGFEKNYEKAVEKYKKAFNLGNGDSAECIADCYQKGGYGINRNFNEAVSWLKKAADSGVTDIYHKIGNIYCEELNDQMAGKAAFEKGVELGEADSLAELGRWYLTNENSIGTAWEYAEKADKAGSALGTSMLHTILITLGKYVEAFDVAARIIKRFNGKFEDRITDIAIAARENDADFETIFTLAKKYFAGANGKVYYQQSLLCLFLAMKKFDSIKSKEQKYDFCKTVVEILSNPECADYVKDLNLKYSAEDAVMIYLSECVKIPNCEDDIKFKYATNLYDKNNKYYNPQEGSVVLDSLLKENYSPAQTFAKKIRSENMAKGLCTACGGTFKGIFSKRCSCCDRIKDY